jgi:hypothetical protein
MRTVTTIADPRQLAIDALNLAGPQLPSALAWASDLDRGMAAADLAAAIRSAASVLTPAERAAFAAALYPEGRAA